MVLPSSAPAPVAGEADWIDHLKVILRLADRSELILVDRARPTKLGELVRGLYRSYPDLRVYADATLLAGAPDKAVIVLEPKRTDAAWLNQERPLIANKQLKIILFCHEDTSAILAREAPDFFNWITHYVECPKGPYPVAVRALRRALCERWSCIQWTTDDLYETFSVALPGRGLRHVSAGLPYGELVEAASQRGREWLVVTGVNSESSAERVTWALLEARRRARVVLLSPNRDLHFPQSNTECISLGAATEVLEQAGAERAGLLAGLLELRGAAVKAAEICLLRAKDGPSVQEEIFRAAEGEEPLVAIGHIGGSLHIPFVKPTLRTPERTFEPIRRIWADAGDSIDGELRTAIFSAAEDYRNARHESAVEKLERILAELGDGKSSLVRGEVLLLLARSLVELKRFPEAESNARRAMEIAEASRLSDEERASISETLARALSKQGKLADAEKVLRLAWILSAALSDPARRELIKAQLAAILRAEGKWDEAELLFSDPGPPHS